MYSSVPPPCECVEDSASSRADCKADGLCSEEGKVDKQEHSNSSNEKPTKVNIDTWQRFQRLKERRREVCKQSPESKKGKQKKKSGTRKETDEGVGLQKQTKSQIFRGNKNAWKELCQNIDVNSHLSQDSTAKGKPKGKLEESLEGAIEEGNFTKAESISDAIAQQELGVKIVGAVEVRDYKKRKETEEKHQKANKKKKLIWGFEQKERWESKGNM